MPCPDCKVKNGSRHNRKCVWAWKKQADHKTKKRLTIRQKIKAIKEIIL